MEPVVHGVEYLATLAGGGGVLRKVVGPAVDEIAESMRRWTAFRVGNVKRIADAADQKMTGDDEGEVHPRIVHRLLEEGSFCDDDLMVEYLGGVLAGSRSAGGRNDQAVAWSDLVTGLSSVQVRAHYLIYRELAVLLHGRSDIQLGLDEGRNQATLVMPWLAFALALHHGTDTPADQWGDTLSHAVPGLVRAGLIADTFGFGDMTTLGPTLGLSGSVLETLSGPQVVVKPSFAGIELYGWAQGLSGLAPQAFIERAEPFATDPPIPFADGRLPLLPHADQSGGSDNAPDVGGVDDHL